MSQFPNNNFNQQQNYYAQQIRPNPNITANGTGSPALNPQVLMNGVRPQLAFNPAAGTGSPTPSRTQNFNPAQLQTLTDFHQRQQLLLAQQQQQQQHQPQFAAQGQGQQRPLQAMQQALQMQQRLQAQGQQTPAALQQFLQAAAAQGLSLQQLQQPPQRRPSLPQSTPSQPPGQSQPQGIPITQAQQAFHPALLAAAAAARASPSANSLASVTPAPALNTPPVGVPPSALTRPPVIPITKAFTPPPRTPSPVKTEPKDSAPAEEVKPSTSVDKDKDKEKPKPKRKPKPKDKDAAKESKDKEDKVNDKGKDDDENKDKTGENTTDKPDDAPKPKRAKPKEKRPRPKKDKAATSPAPAVYFAAVEPVAKDVPGASDEPQSKDGAVVKDVGEEKRSADVKTVERLASPVRTAAPAEPRRRREEGMRGSMRNEIARLMYGAGDVLEPDIDSVDYMEDLVTEFLADLSRPIPPLRSGPPAQHQPIPMSFDIIRHRLSTTPFMHKYLERFDHMVHMSDVLKAHRRIANPSVNDLVEQVGNEYLGLDEEGTAVHGHGQAGRPGKRYAEGREDGARKKGRPLKNPGEKRKPGPQKGWKLLNRDPHAPVRRPVPKDPNAPKRKYVRKSGVGAGVKRDPAAQ